MQYGYIVAQSMFSFLTDRYFCRISKTAENSVRTIPYFHRKSNSLAYPYFLCLFVYCCLTRWTRIHFSLCFSIVIVIKKRINWRYLVHFIVKGRFRLSPNHIPTSISIFDDLLKRVKEDLTKRNVTMKITISPEEKLVVCLR
jgi:hypothetical protein